MEDIKTITREEYLRNETGKFINKVSESKAAAVFLEMLKVAAWAGANAAVEYFNKKFSEVKVTTNQEPKKDPETK